MLHVALRSKVLFVGASAHLGDNVGKVCTANELDTIPGPLLDRMEADEWLGHLIVADR